MYFFSRITFTLKLCMWLTFIEKHLIVDSDLSILTVVNTLIIKPMTLDLLAYNTSAGKSTRFEHVEKVDYASTSLVKKEKGTHQIFPTCLS